MIRNAASVAGLLQEAPEGDETVGRGRLGQIALGTANGKKW